MKKSIVSLSKSVSVQLDEDDIRQAIINFAGGKKDPDAEVEMTNDGAVVTFAIVKEKE